MTDSRFGFNGPAQASGGGGGDGSSPTNIITGIIRRNDMNVKRVKTLQAKVMHQRDIYTQRFRTFIDGAVEMLRGIQQNITNEMEATLRQRQQELVELQEQCMNRALEFRNIKDRGGQMSTEEFSRIEKGVADTEQLIESLNNFDLVITPSMVGAMETMRNEKPAYIRTSPLFPLDAKVTSIKPSQPSTGIAVVAITVSSEKPEPRLPLLLAGTLEKLETVNGRVVVVPASAIEGVITTIPHQENGGCEVAFPLPESDRDTGGDYLIKVTMYGRPIKNSPMKVRVKFESNMRQMLELPVHNVTVDDTLPPPPVYTPLTGTGIGRPQSRSQGMVETSQPTTGSREPQAVPTRAPPTTTKSSRGPDVLAMLAVPGLLDRMISPLKPEPKRWSIGVGRGGPLTRSPAMVAPSVPGPSSAIDTLPPVVDAVQEMDDYYSKLTNTMVKPVPKKDIVTEASLAASNIRLPRAISATESILAAAERQNLDDHLGPSRGYAASVMSSLYASQGLYANETLDLSQETLRPPSTTLEESNRMAAFQSRTGSIGRIQLRADLTGLLGDEGCPRDVGGILVGKFGFENTQDPPEYCFSSPIGCTKDNMSGDYIICDTEHHVVKIFDVGMHLKQINTAAFQRPAAVVSLDDKRYAIRDDRAIQIFTKENELLNTIRNKTQGGAYGLALDTHGNLLTLEIGRQGAPSYIFMYDQFCGEEIDRIPFTAHVGKQGSRCRFIDCYNDRLYVADLGASTIYCTLLEGGINVLEFGGAGKMPGQFLEPSGISMDANGNLFIGDSRNDRIQIFSPTGAYMGKVKFDCPIKRPSGIHLTADGHLMVMNYLQHYVALFKLIPLQQ